MNEFSPPLSRNEAILQNILGANNPLEPARSRIEAILLSILNNTAYTDPPLSRIEALLLAIKNKTEYTGAVISRNEKILYAKLTGGEYPDPPLSRIEELLIEWLNASSGEETTVSGVPPITLANALAAALVSLTQYGLCDQSSTPTPSAPQDIACNNGVLRMVDDELPLGYKRLTGIRFDGNIHYETGEALTGDDDVTMTLDNTASQGQNVFGSYNGTSSGTKNFSLFIYGNGASTGSYLRYGEQLLRPKFGSGERTITFGKSGTDGFATDASATPDTFVTPANAYIGMLPNSTSPAYTGDIIGNIVVGTRLKWIPCERESDNAIGYYEAVKGNFIAPSGTGTPTSLGYDGTHYHLAVVGDNEVLWIDDGNMLPPNVEVGVLYPFSGAAGNRTISVKVNNGENLQAFEFHYYKADKTQINYYTISNYDSESGRMHRTISLTNTTAYVSITQKAAYPTATVSEVKLEAGSTPTGYVTPQTATVPDLFAVGIYADEVEIISGGVTRKCGIKVLDGTETGWALSDSGTIHRFRGTKPSDCFTPSGRAPIASTHFVYIATGQGLGGAFIGASAYWYFIPTDQTLDTADAWRAWLAAQYAAGTPVIVLYPLDEETTETVTAQSLNTEAGTNIISVTAYVNPTIEVTYLKEAEE